MMSHQHFCEDCKTYWRCSCNGAEDAPCPNCRLMNEKRIIRLEAALKRLEYVRHTDGGRVHEFCPACGFCPEHGHAPDCWLAKELEGK